MSAIKNLLDRLAGVPPRPHSTDRLVTVPGDVWLAAQAVATVRGETVAQVVERSLREYANPIGG